MRFNPTSLLCVVAFFFCGEVAAEEAWLGRQRKLYDQSLSGATPKLEWIKKSESAKNLVTGKLQNPKKQLELQKTLPIRALDLSIDWDQLSYDGCRKINRDDVLTPTQAQLLELKSDYHRYSYAKNVLVYSKRLDTRDQLLVHGCLRALQILKLRYTQLYNDLIAPRGFLSTAELKEKRKQDKVAATAGAPWINVRRRFIIVVNNNGTESAQSIYLLGNSKKVELGEKRKVSVYHNAVVVTLNIAHLSHRGSAVVYQGMSKRDAFLHFIRDGLIETLVHESLHCYISENKHLNAQLQTIRGFQSVTKGGFGNRGKSIEEAIVCNSSLRFFEAQARRESGLHPHVFRFYRKSMLNKVHFPKVEALNRVSKGKLFQRLKVKPGQALSEALLIRRPYLN